MRVLLFKKEDGPFFFSYALPSSKELGRIDECVPCLQKMLLQHSDKMRSFLISEIRRDCTSFLKISASHVHTRTPKSIELVCPTRGTVRGPATGMSGISINKKRYAVSIDDDMVLLEWFEGEQKFSQPIHGDRLAVDDGHVLVRFCQGGGMADLCLQMQNSLESLKQKTVWSMVES